MILTDEQALRVKCVDVLPEEVEDIKAKLENELDLSAKRGRPGIGLAAPQIGIPKKMAIVRLKDSSSGKEYNLDLVNATINKGYDLQLFQGEGCLSFPDRVETTKRYNEIHVLDNMVEPKQFVATGLLAVVIQHECDHYRGVLLPDVAIQKIEKQQEKQAFKVRPNDPCPCGSNKKYKKCCKVS